MRGWLGPARMAKGLTQEEMAKKLDISPSYYFLIESGRRQKKMDITLVAKICSVLGLPIARVIEMELQPEGGG